jgi:hypothetical protein
MDVGEGLAAEPALPNEAHLILDARLVLGAPRPCGIDEEAPRLGVLEEGGIDDRVLSIGFEDRRLEVIDDGSGHDPTEVLPSSVESGDDRTELLVEGGMDELVSAVRERHDQGPDRAALPSDGIGPLGHLAEVDLRLLAGGWIVESDGGLLLSRSQLAVNESSKGRVADLDASPLKQCVDLGERQRLLFVREPTVDGRFVLEQDAPLIAPRGCRLDLNVANELPNEAVVDIDRGQVNLTCNQGVDISTDGLAVDAGLSRDGAK